MLVGYRSWRRIGLWSVVVSERCDMSEFGVGPWLAFCSFLVFMLALDLGLFHRQARVVSLRESLLWSGVWVLMALIFAGVVRELAGPDVALDFLTGYLIEKSLSIDNVFVFALIFAAMKVP
ncbi:MAG: hypothetical protein ACKPEY_19555, partial [Planctomycetota bacterium]